MPGAVFSVNVQVGQQVCVSLCALCVCLYPLSVSHTLSLSLSLRVRPGDARSGGVRGGGDEDAERAAIVQRRQGQSDSRQGRQNSRAR